MDNKKVLLNNGHWDFDGIFIRLIPWWNATVALPSISSEGFWMEVKGVPFDLWGNKFYQELGMMFGGLMEVHASTLSWSDASAIRVKVRNFNGLSISFVF